MDFAILCTWSPYLENYVANFITEASEDTVAEEEDRDLVHILDIVGRAPRGAVVIPGVKYFVDTIYMYILLFWRELKKLREAFMWNTKMLMFSRPHF